jgi:hypothetical protein
MRWIDFQKNIPKEFNNCSSRKNFLKVLMDEKVSLGMKK